MRAWLLTGFGLSIILLAFIFSAFGIVEKHPYFSELLNWTLSVSIAAIALREESEE
jgi:hypothetical protein